MRPGDYLDEYGEPKRKYLIPQRDELMYIYPNLQEKFSQARNRVDERRKLPGSNRNGPERIITRTRARLIAFCRLWSIVEWFIGDYCKKRSLLLRRLFIEKKKRENAKKADKSKMESVDDLDEKDYPDIVSEIDKGSLSYREYGRLQRGFLLFELHRQLFAPCSSSHEEVSLFIGCLSYIEIAELLTVYDYLIEEVAKVADIKENFAYSCLVKEIQLRRERNIKSNHTNINKIFDAELDGIHVRLNNLKPLRRYKINRHQYKQHAYLIELGLPFCRHLIERMTLRQQTAMLWLCRKRLRSHSLNQILHATKQQNWAAIHLAPHDGDSIRRGLHKVDTLLDKGRPERLLRWLSCLEADEISPSSPKCTKVKLQLQKRIFTSYAWRQLGWFIWDDWRFESSFTKDSERTVSIPNICEADEKEDKFWERQLSALYYIWLRDQHQRRILKFEQENLEQVLHSLGIAEDYSLPGARGVRIFAGNRDGEAGGENSEYLKHVNNIFQESLEVDPRIVGYPFKDWLRDIDYSDVTHGHQRPWHFFSQ